MSWTTYAGSKGTLCCGSPTVPPPIPPTNLHLALGYACAKRQQPRLGALQRKLPSAHMFLLWVLAGIELVSFPLLGAGTQTIGGYNILTVEGVLFGVMTFGIVLTLRTIGELWEGRGGVYNVDGVLETMVTGLEEELDERRREAEESEGSIQIQIPDVPERRK